MKACKHCLSQALYSMHNATPPDARTKHQQRVESCGGWHLASIWSLLRFFKSVSALLREIDLFFPDTPTLGDASTQKNGGSVMHVSVFIWFALALSPEQASTIITWSISQNCQIQFVYVSDRTHSYEHDAGTILHDSCNPTHKFVFRWSSFLLTAPIYVLQSSLSRRAVNVEIWTSHFPLSPDPPLQCWFWFQSSMEYPGLVLDMATLEGPSRTMLQLREKYDEPSHSPTLKGPAPASVCT